MDARHGGTRLNYSRLLRKIRSGRRLVAGLKHQRAAARERERLNRLLVDNSLGLMCIHDLVGVLVAVNPAAARSLGFEIQEGIGRNLRDWLAPAVRHRFGKYLSRIRNNATASGLMRLVAKDGSERIWLYRNSKYESEGNPTLVVGHALDITDRVKAGRALKHGEQRFRELFDYAPIAYHEIDRNGIIRRVNKAECDLLGKDSSELIGRPVWEQVVPEFRENSRREVHRKLAGLQEIAPFIREYQRKDGTQLTVEIHERLIRGARGDVQGMRSALIDITARRKAEIRIQTLNAELEQRVVERTAALARSNDALKQFAYTVSHDLQEPLRSITGFASLLAARHSKALPEEGVEFLEQIADGAERMTSMIRGLLEYSRLLQAPVSAEPVKMEAVFDAALLNLEAAIAESSAVITRGALPIVAVDPQLLMQVFQNLLSNSIKYCTVKPPVIHVCAQEAGGEWIFCIQDNGIGIDRANLGHVFAVFKRLHGREIPGSGIGLSICRAIIERHGGRIWAESEPGAGSKFYFAVSSYTGERSEDSC